ncbi:hypothetical protein J2T12_004861 [Paenibacillus anaericanus]|nr:hypothetical protein [Paenibacillus anaericanus]
MNKRSIEKPEGGQWWSVDVGFKARCSWTLALISEWMQHEFGKTL